RFELVGGTQHPGTFAAAVETLHLHAGVAGIAAPRILHADAAARAGIGRREQGAADTDLRLAAPGLRRELPAKEQLVAGAGLARILQAELQARVIAQLDRVFRLGVEDIDDVLAVVIDRADREAAFPEVGSAGENPAIDAIRCACDSRH